MDERIILLHILTLDFYENSTFLSLCDGVCQQTAIQLSIEIHKTHIQTQNHVRTQFDIVVCIRRRRNIASSSIVIKLFFQLVGEPKLIE